MRIALYLAVVVVAMTQREPWAIAVQAAVGGFALGTSFEQWFSKRERSSASEAMAVEQNAAIFNPDGTTIS